MKALSYWLFEKQNQKIKAKKVLEKDISIERQPVQSSNLLSIGYNPKFKILEIEFNTGAVYRYYNISPKLNKELMEAKSKGSFFHKKIKKANFSYKKIESK